MTEFSSAADRVLYGLETIPDDQEVSIGLRDLMFIHQALGELVQFFHQPLHMPNLESVTQYLGSRGSGGAYDVLSEAYYERLRDVLPPEIDTAFDEGTRFEHPSPPAYFKSDEEDA